MDGHGQEKFRDASLLETSVPRPWSLIAAEVRSHAAGEIPAFTPTNGELTQILRDRHDAVSVRASGGVRQELAARPGTVWLCPAGIREEATRLTADIPAVMHIYLPQHSFLTGELATLGFRASDLRYEAGVNNPRVFSILAAVVQELRQETASGALRADSLAVDLIATLAADHADAPGSPPPMADRGGLDRRRADRVLAFIEENLEADISLAEMAEEACVSVFHFARAFHQTLGMAPHAYLSRRRLDVAKRRLALETTPLADIALSCRFSSQANFTRAFTRAVGMSPGRYRTRLGDL